MLTIIIIIYISFLLYLKELDLDSNPSLLFLLICQVTEGVNYKPGPSVGCVKCIYSEGSWRCGEKSIPLSKYCAKHILHVSMGKEVGVGGGSFYSFDNFFC